MTSFPLSFFELNNWYQRSSIGNHGGEDYIYLFRCGGGADGVGEDGSAEIGLTRTQPGGDNVEGVLARLNGSSDSKDGTSGSGCGRAE